MDDPARLEPQASNLNRTMFDQADKLRQLVRETTKGQPILKPGVPLVAISGAQRGVGTSTVAIHLAHELAQLGKRVVLVDANILAPRLAGKLDISCYSGLADVLNGRRSVPEVLEQTGDGIQLLPGVDLMSNESGLNTQAVGRLVAELRSLQNNTDLVLIDAGAAMNPWIERLWTSAMQVFLVTTPEPSTVLESYATVKLAPWVEIDGRLRLVVNRCNEVDLGIRASDGFTSTCRRFLGMKLLGEAAVLAFDSQLPSGTRTLSHRSPFRRSLRLLAADLLSQSYTLQGSKCPAKNVPTTPDAQMASLVDSSPQTAHSLL